MLIRLFFFLISCIYSQYHPHEWGSITSLLTPTGIQIATDGTVYASTSGGLLEFNPNTEKFTAIKMENSLIYLDLSCIEIDNQGRLNHGGINWEHESSDIAELRPLLHVLESNGMAVKISGEQFKTIDYDSFENDYYINLT